MADAIDRWVYKVFLPEQFAAFEAQREFLGSADDQRDGFIHLSFAHQVPGTIQKHFAGRSDLALVEFDAHSLGPALVLEPSRDGQRFPHLYTTLAWEQIHRICAPTELRGEVEHAE